MRLPIAIALCLALVRTLAAEQATGTVTGKLVLVRDGAAIVAPADEPAFVYLLDTRKRHGKPPTRSAEIIHRDRKFIPAVSMVSTGTTLTFPNVDIETHNAFSNTEGLRFDLGRYGHDERPTRVFDDPGEVDLYCDIHKDMWAKIKIVDTAYFAPVVAGTFRVTNVPPGTYKAIGWYRDSRESAADELVTVTAGGTATIATPIQLQAGSRKSEHRRKDGSAYPPYH